MWVRKEPCPEELPLLKLTPLAPLGSRMADHLVFLTVIYLRNAVPEKRFILTLPDG